MIAVALVAFYVSVPVAYIRTLPWFDRIPWAFGFSFFTLGLTAVGILFVAYWLVRR
jgi:hypothetical protein